MKADKIIPHGEAVALGMIAETHLANLEKLITEETTEIIKISEDFFYISIEEFKNDEIINLMINDKENNHGKFNFSLLVGIGKCNYGTKVI